MQQLGFRFFNFPKTEQRICFTICIRWVSICEEKLKSEVSTLWTPEMEKFEHSQQTDDSTGVSDVKKHIMKSSLYVEHRDKF